MAEELRQVGVPQRTLRNSPIRERGADEQDEATAAGMACFFNDEAFPNGAEVVSGQTVLICEAGQWVVMGHTELRPN